MKNREVILKVFNKWNRPNGQFDAMWYGYDVFLEEVQEIESSITLKELKKEIKLLHKEGVIRLLPTFDWDYKLSGRGWFLSH